MGVTASSTVIEASASKGDARRARVPVISVPEELPIAVKAEEITAAIRAHQIGDVVTATIVRDGQRSDISVSLTARPH